jgi:beta-phosphoglucomutase-like phosphatase (HAD superfamily)
MIRAALFDIDGTLIDSVDAHAHAWTTAFHNVGVGVSFDAVRAQIGKGGDKLMPVFLDEEQVARIGKDIEQRQGELFRTQYLDEIKPFAGVRPLFERLRDDGVSRVLASSAKAEEVMRYREIAGIADLVEAQATSEDAEESKPAPDIVKAALSRIPSVEPADCLFIGDTPYDAEAAVRARITPVGVLCGGFDELGLRSAGCVAVYRDIQDLLQHYADVFLAGR